MPTPTDAPVVGQLAREVDFVGRFGAALLAIKRDDKNVRWSQAPGGQLGEQTIQVQAGGRVWIKPTLERCVSPLKACNGQLRRALLCSSLAGQV